MGDMGMNPCLIDGAPFHGAVDSPCCSRSRVSSLVSTPVRDVKRFTRAQIFGSISAYSIDEPSISAGGSPVPGNTACHIHGREPLSRVAVTVTFTGVPEASAHEKNSRMGLGSVCIRGNPVRLFRGQGRFPVGGGAGWPRPFSTFTVTHKAFTD